MTKQKSKHRTPLFGFASLFFILVLLFWPKSALASRIYDDIVVSVESASSGETFYGYVEYKILVTNDSQKDAHKVTLFAPFRSYGGGDYVRRIERSVVVGPASSANVTLLQPPLCMEGDGLGVDIDGERKREPVALDTSFHCKNNYSLGYGWSRSNPLCILLSRNVSFDDFQNGIEQAFPSSVGSPARYMGTKVVDFIRSESPVRAWSGNWLAYSRYDGLVVSASDIRQMPASVTSALFQYIECGGTLLVLGGWNLPEQIDSEPVKFGPINQHYIGFGVCVLTDSTDVGIWGTDVWKELKNNIWGTASSQLQNKLGIANANKQFPVVENLSIPVKGLFVLVLCFAVVIGPVNIAVLSRKKRRIWLLWMVPAISIVASLAVFFYAFLAEGWRGYIRIQSITILNQATQKAASIGINAFYSPLTPRGGLRFDYETEVTPISLQMWQGGRARTVNWTNEQHFGTGWVVARVPAHFYLRKNQVRRERIVISSNGQGQLTAVNGLGSDVRSLWFADENGRIYSAENIMAGAQANLSDSGATVSLRPEPKLFREFYKSDWSRKAEDIIKNPNYYLKPNCYIAVVDDSVFIEEALENVKSRRFESVIIGMLKGG